MTADNSIAQSTPVSGMTACLHGLKQRVKRYHGVG